jgi:hypothetical protein
MKTRSTRVKSAGSKKVNMGAAAVSLVIGIVSLIAVPYLFYLLFQDFQLTNRTDITPYVLHVSLMIASMASAIIFFNLYMKFKGITQPSYTEES